MDPILIIDDEKDNLEALKRLLRTSYEVTTETSPFEALRLLQKTAFHVIISDQRMPEMKGVELLEKAKKLSPASTRVLLTGYTDIDSVIDAINRGNIYRYIAKPWDPEDLKLTLKQANEAYLLRKEIEDKNAELQKSNSDLEKALTELKALDKAKARFLSLISHELNTPLTVVSSFVQLLEQMKNSLPSEIQKAVSSIGSASNRFSEIISEVITYVRLESGQSLELSAFDFSSEIKEIEKKLKSQLEKKKVTLAIEGKGDTSIRCDAEKMRLAVTKLLQDTIERAIPGSEIEVSTERVGSDLHLLLSRKGDPLPDNAFQPFETGSSEQHHHKNLGLSLAIGRLILEGHGGSLNREKADQGKQKLVITIPARAL